MIDTHLVKVIDLGKIDFKDAWDIQESYFNRIVAHKLENRKREESGEDEVFTGNYMLICEHPHVYTLGKSGEEENLLIDTEGLESKEASFYKINRGGDITYHGPGQLVVYPILNLDYFFTDIHKYLRFLEEAVIKTLAEYGIDSGRYDGYTGVWLEADSKVNARKICAMGVRCSRWVTMHGLALNVDPDLSYFGNIVPCGITDHDITSISKEVGRSVALEEVKPKLIEEIATAFEMNLSYEEVL